MNLEKDSAMLTLIFAGDMVQYRDRIWPTGTVACQAMNISKDDLNEAAPLCRRIAPVITMLRTGSADKAAMNSARMAAHSLLEVLSRNEPFTFFAIPELDQQLDKVFTIDAFKKIRAYNTAILNKKMDEEAIKKYGPSKDLQSLAPALANYYDAVTLLQDHIAPFAKKLDAKDLQRTKDAYLIQFNKSFPEEILLGDDSDSWMSMANVTVQYTSGRNIESKQWQMQKHMHFVSFGGMLRADFFEGLSVGHAPKRCAICGRWFLTTNARKTKYCSDICPDDPKGRKCRVIGNMRGRAYRELAADHPLNEPYERRMKTINQYLKRGTLDPTVASMMKKLAKDKKQQAKASLCYAKGSYAEEMEHDALKAEAERLLQRS